MRRLLPNPGPVAPEEQYGDLGLAALAHANRPYTVANLSMTADGRVAIGGRDEAIGGDRDWRVVELLRTQADALLIGARTMRVHRYDRIASKPELRALRERAGLAPDPLAVLVTGSLDLPWEAGLFGAGAGEVVIHTSAEGDPPAPATPVEVVRHPGRVDLAALMADLRRRGVRSVLCEGGPTLLAGLVALGLLDELFLTVAPKLAGEPGAPALIEGPLAEPVAMELVWLLEEGGELFCRYRLAAG